jgi:hypothetical protein
LDAEAPRRIARYELLEELGRGMMGVVYRARDTLLDRIVALKTIHLALGIPESERQSFEERFFVEARSAARLSHPGIVIVHDVGRDPDDGTLYMALEHLKGRTLATVIHEAAPLPWREAVRITARVAEALGHAHSEGVVHRDIKPANIMLLDSGEPKIMDFGIAKMATATTRLTSTGQFFGTPLFMAPEQALGQPVDGRSDLFSLGTVAYELLTARRPFEADNVPRILTRVAYEEPEPPSSLVSGLPSAIDDVIARALAKPPGDRYPSGEAFAQDLEDVIAGRVPRHLTARPLPRTGLQTQLTTWTKPAPPATERPAVSGVAATSTPRAGSPAGADWDSPEAALSSLAFELRPEGRRRRGRRVLMAAVAALGLISVLGFGVAYWFTKKRPTASGPTAGPATTPEPAEPRAAGPTTTADTALLALDFEHHLKSGTLKVWIDRKLELETPLSGVAARTLPGLTLHKGYLESELELSPGQHDIWVEVRWDDNIKSNGVTTRFEPGATRRLKVRVGRIRKNVSLEWI